MEKDSDIQFMMFDWLRFPLIVGVVFIHCFGKPFNYEANMTKVTYDIRYYIYVVAAILWMACTIFNGHNTKTGDMLYPFYVIVGCMATINFATDVVKKYSKNASNPQ